MPSAEPPSTDLLPGGDGGPVALIVWSLADSHLAAPLGAVIEVAPVGPDGLAHTRAGPVGLVLPPGVREPGVAPALAVVLATGDGRAAVAADVVEGVIEADPGAIRPPPRWLGGLAGSSVRGTVRLDGQRIAALLDPGRLPAAP